MPPALVVRATVTGFIYGSQHRGTWGAQEMASERLQPVIKGYSSLSSDPICRDRCAGLPPKPHIPHCPSSLVSLHFLKFKASQVLHTHLPDSTRTFNSHANLVLSQSPCKAEG